MRRLLSSEHGFSMVQGLVFAGVLAGSSLVATRLFTDQKKALKGSETRDQIEQLHQNIFTTLQNPDNCTATVRGLAGLRPGEGAYTLDIANDLVDSPGAPYPTTRTINAVTRLDAAASGTVYNQAKHVFGVPYTNASGTPVNPTYMNGNVIIRKMEWEYFATRGIPTVLNPNPPAPSQGIAYLHIDYERLNPDPTVRLKDGYGGKNIRKTIVLRMQRKFPVPATNAFVACYAIENPSIAQSGNADIGTIDLSKELCNSLNSSGSSTLNADEDPTLPDSLLYWDENTSNCLQRERVCPNDRVFTGIDSNGRTMCRDVSTYVDMSQYIDTTPANCGPGKTVSIVPAGGGKVRIQCL